MLFSAGINGFGRFGLHLLKYWIDNYDKTKFDIEYINDDFLDQNKILEIIKNDTKIKFKEEKFNLEDDYLLIENFRKNKKKKIKLTNFKPNKISWIGQPDIFFECSGKNTSKEKSNVFLKENTKIVLISATSYDVDKTLIYSFNHKEFTENLKILSYGSCTVNAYVPLANYINEKYGIISSDVNIVHNLPRYQINTDNLRRKFCTLETSGKKLLEFLNDDNFIVNYTLAPFTGISSIDIRFEVQKIISKENILKDLINQIENKKLLYGLNQADNIDKYNLSKNNIELEIDGIKVIGKNIYFQGFFDNENSVNRYFDLANYILNKI